MNDAGGVLDEEQYAEPLEEDCVDVEQIARPDALGLRFEELTPTRAGATWRRTEPGSFEDVTHWSGRHPKAGAGQFAADALITP
ncbi:hypothetical protein [Microtetraspora malaysiensis]|uniref:hypothetical protein n=1 Tax=Microtetraspora malaysiensis TaxID=161358 RepID=UPI003D95016A